MSGLDPFSIATVRMLAGFLLPSAFICVSGLLAARFFRWDAAKREWILRITLVLVLAGPITTAVMRSSRVGWNVDLSNVRTVAMYAAVADAFSTSASGRVLGFAFVGIWIAGVLVLSTRTAISTHKAISLVRRSAGSPSLSKLLEGLCSRRQIPNARLRVRVSDELGSPAVFGWRKSTILIPREHAERISDDDMSAILLHELAHIHRRDQFWVVAQQLAKSIFWPNPFIGMLNRQLTRAREEVCDNHAISIFGATFYSRVLLMLANDRAGIPLMAMSIRSEHWTLEERIQSILDNRRKAIVRVRRRFAAVALVALGALAGTVGLCRPVLFDRYDEATYVGRSEHRHRMFGGHRTVTARARDRLARRRMAQDVVAKLDQAYILRPEQRDSLEELLASLPIPVLNAAHVQGLSEVDELQVIEPLLTPAQRALLQHLPERETPLTTSSVEREYSDLLAARWGALFDGVRAMRHPLLEARAELQSADSSDHPPLLQEL